MTSTLKGKFIHGVFFFDGLPPIWNSASGQKQRDYNTCFMLGFFLKLVIAGNFYSLNVATDNEMILRYKSHFWVEIIIFYQSSQPCVQLPFGISYRIVWVVVVSKISQKSIFFSVKNVIGQMNSLKAIM